MIVWQKKQGERRYCVTSAGSSMRLYTDGVFHSQYNSRQPVGGNLWDLLFVPALMHQHPLNLQRVLVLGVGGGAVIRQLNHFLQPREIIGVDLDEVHLQVARRFFKVTAANTTLIQAEAQEWLQTYRGPKFDLIIEDVFKDGGSGGIAEPVRGIPADANWLDLLQRHLTSCGVLVMNFESAKSLTQSAFKQLLHPIGPFAGGYRFSHAGYENVVAAFSRQPLRRGQFTQALQTFKELDRRRKTCRLRFHCRKLVV